MIYEQSTGKLWASDGVTLLANCYSGFSIWKNDPNSQELVGRGPIPAGWYTIGEPEYAKPGETSPHGPYVLPLTPDPDNQMWDRAGFLIHGDNIHTPGTASHGCIIPLEGLWDAQKRPLTGRPLREGIYGRGDRRVQVVARLTAAVPVS